MESGRTILRFFFASAVVGGEEEIQPSHTENGRVSESKRIKKKS